MLIMKSISWCFLSDNWDKSQNQFYSHQVLQELQQKKNIYGVMIGLYWFMHTKKAENYFSCKKDYLSHKHKLIIYLSCEHAAGNSWN